MLNQNIKNLRKEKGYTQETLAQELDVVRQTVSKWEKGYSVPDAIMLERMAELFDVPVSSLLDDTKEQTSSDSTDIKMISEQLSILNSQFAKELARRKKRRKIGIIFVSVFFAAVLVCAFFLLRPQEVPVTDAGQDGSIPLEVDAALERAISETIISNNVSSYPPGEFHTESHYIYGTDHQGDYVTVYLLEDYSEFGFCNGFFTDISGGRTPGVFTYVYLSNADGYECVKSEYPQDGSDYSDSVKKLFPHKIAKQIINGYGEENSYLWENQVRAAKAYLASIGRTAEVCNFGDIQNNDLSVYGVTDDVADKICRNYSEYPYNIGNLEKIENGIRYVYQTEYDMTNDYICFVKFEYDNGKIVEFTAADSETGRSVANARVPDKAEYFIGKKTDKE